MGKNLITFLFRSPKLPELPPLSGDPGIIPTFSEYDAKNLPPDVRKKIADGAPVIDVPRGYIKAHKKMVRAAQKAARKAEKKATKKGGLKSGSGSGAPLPGISAFADQQSAASFYFVRETKPQSGRKGGMPYLYIIMLAIVLTLMHRYGVF